MGTIHSLWGITGIETPYQSSVAEVLTLRQVYKGWEVGCVHSTLLESVMSGGESVGMILMILIRLFRFISSSVSFPIMVHWQRSTDDYCGKCYVESSGKASMPWMVDKVQSRFFLIR